MGSSAELTLGRPCHGVEHGAFAGMDVDQMFKLELYLKALENERKKIEAFKRELPFCMQLLSDEIETSKEQLADHQEPATTPPSTVTSACKEYLSGNSSNVTSLLDEFLPSKKPADDVKEGAYEHSAAQYLTVSKPKGVIRTKFWTPIEAYAHGQKMVSSMTENTYKKQDPMRMISEEDLEIAKPILDPQKRGGAFLPFCASQKHVSAEHLVTAVPHSQNTDANHGPRAKMVRSSANISAGVHSWSVKETQNALVAVPTGSCTNSTGQSTQRKPRRCWSPELHSRFVKALQQLGGSEVATPKQIRELMNIDGLTNDEVKSHLQKYRLHTRRPGASFHESCGQVPQVVVLGGIWVPSEYAAAQAASHVRPQPEADESPATQAASPLFADERCIKLNTAAGTHLQLYGFNGEARSISAVTAAQSQGSSEEPLQRLSSSTMPSSEEGNDDCRSL